MTIEWPAAAIIVALVLVAGAVILGAQASRPGSLSRARIAAEEAKAKNEAQYEALAKETRDVQAAMQADLAAVRQSVEAMEQMMREVG